LEWIAFGACLCIGGLVIWLFATVAP